MAEYDTRATGDPIPAADANTAARPDFDNVGQVSSKENRDTDVNVYKTLDLTNGHVFDLTITNTTELSLEGMVGNTPIVIILTDDGNGAHTITFNSESDSDTATIKWAGTAYSATTASQVDVINGVYRPTANEWLMTATTNYS